MKPVTGSLPIPELTTHRVDTGDDAADQALADLQANKDVWATLNIPARVVILEEIQRDLGGLGQAWVNASLQAKGVPAGGFAEGEEWTIYGGSCACSACCVSHCSAFKRAVTQGCQEDR
jgi:hypothetical protein